MATYFLTGQSGGIGRAISQKLMDNRSSGDFIICPSRSVAEDDHRGIDMSSKNSIDLFFAKHMTDEDLGETVDVLINNAGINHLMWLKDLDYDIMDKIFKVNVLGYLYLIKKCLERNVKRIINIGSVAGRVPMTCSSIYCCSKSAVDMITRQAARELAIRGIAVYGVDPGRVSGTKMGDMVDPQVAKLRGWTIEQVKEYQMQSIPGKRFVTPQEVADVVYWLATEAPISMTGSILIVGEGVC